MKNLGISVYPQKASLEDNLHYIEKASSLGFNRLFVALLGVEASKEAILKDYAPITLRAKELGYEVSCDIWPDILNKVCGAGSFGNYDLSFFKEIGISTLRLDMGFSEIEEAIFSKNQAGINLELNMSFPIDHVGNLLKSGGERSRISGCHNYYPHRYTGLSLKFFEECNAIWEPYHLNTAAFISTQSTEKSGPWPICDGLPTLEIHRDLPIEVQLKHYIAMGFIDDVYIGDSFASEQEMKRLSELDKNTLSFRANLVDDIEGLEKILAMKFSRRPDSNDFMIRTLESRFLLSRNDIPPFNTIDIKRGDILLENNDYGQYKGEIQIALKPMRNSGRTNVIGHLSPDEDFLLDYVKPGQEFCFEVIKK